MADLHPPNRQSNWLVGGQNPVTGGTSYENGGGGLCQVNKIQDFKKKKREKKRPK